MAEPGIDLAKQFPDRRGVAWRHMHGGSEMTGRRLTPGVEPAGAVERGIHGLSPGHPHTAEPRPSPGGPRPPRGARPPCREGAVDMLSVAVWRPRTCRWGPFTGHA